MVIMSLSRLKQTFNSCAELVGVARLPYVQTYVELFRNRAEWAMAVAKRRRTTTMPESKRSSQRVCQSRDQL